MKIEMEIVYIILNVHNFSQMNLSKLRDTSQNQEIYFRTLCIMKYIRLVNLFP